MIALFLMLAAPAAAPAADAEPPAASPAPPPAKVCTRAPGSDTVVCRPAQQQNSYRLPKFGPAAPRAYRGDGVKLRGQVSNRGRRNRPTATLGIPF